MSDIAQSKEQHSQRRSGRHRSRRPTSSDSGYDTNSDRPDSPIQERQHSQTSTQVRDTTESQEIQPAIETEQSASLLSFANSVDITPSIGTELRNVQLSSLDHFQLDELADLVAERGVVIFHDQELAPTEQLSIFDHYETGLGMHIVENNSRFTKIKTYLNDHGENFTHVPGQQSKWRSDRSFEATPPSLSMIKANGAGPDLAWVSTYGVYDALSSYMKRFLDDLRAVHTSSLQYSSIANLRGLPADRSPVESQHPAVQTHPVTGLKALNISPASTSHFSELSEFESRKLLELVSELCDSLPQQTVRLTLEPGSVALWDNRCTVHKTLPSRNNGIFQILATSCNGQAPSFNSNSESRDERVQRLGRQAEEERIRKARFSNTPLRRILRKQSSGIVLVKANSQAKV